MRFTIEPAAAAALAAALRASPKVSPIPAYEVARLDAADGRVVATAGDPSVSVRVDVAADVAESGTTTVRGAVAAAVLARCAGPVSVSADAAGVVVIDGGDSFTLPVVGTVRYPWPPVPELGDEFAGDEFAAAVAAVEPFASADPETEVLHLVRLDPGVVAAGCTVRFATVPCPVQVPASIPLRAARTMVRFVPPGPVRMGIGPGHLHVVGDGVAMAVALSACCPPPYADLAARPLDSEVEVDGDALRDAVHAASAVATGDVPTVSLDLADGLVVGAVGADLHVAVPGTPTGTGGDAVSAADLRRAVAGVSGQVTVGFRPGMVSVVSSTRRAVLLAVRR